MLVRVEIGGWEHQCCGVAYEIGGLAELDLYLAGERKFLGNAESIESHHDLLTNGSQVRARVVGVEVHTPQGSLVPITRLPTGFAARGFGGAESGDVIGLERGRIVESETNDFVLTLDVEERSQLPVEPAGFSS